MRSFILSVLVLTALAVTQPGCLSEVNHASTTQQSIDLRVKQANGIADAYAVAKADVGVLCDKKVIDLQTCIDFSESFNLLDPMVSGLQTAAEEDTDVDYKQIFTDLQPRLLALTIDIAIRKRDAATTLTIVGRP